MKFAKRIFKPFVVLYALAGMAAIAIAKHMITALSIRSLYKHISKLNAEKNRLYRMVANPYRISNGIFPAAAPIQMNRTVDMQRCHEMIAKARLARASS